MSIPEDMIMRHLNMLLDNSEPGATIHYLHIIAAPAGATGPLGTADPTKLEASIYAIAPDTPTPQEVPHYIRRVTAAAAADQAAKGLTIMFAAAGQEMWFAPVGDEHGRRLQAEGRLGEHADAVEMTLVYAACRDGRRWRGGRYLTGPQAGEKIAIETLVGRVSSHETSGIAAARGILKMVGIDQRGRVTDDA